MNRLFTEKEIQMALKIMNIPASFLIKEKQIEVTMKYYLSPIRISKYLKIRCNSLGENKGILVCS